MVNGSIDAAQTEAILGGGQEKVNRYLVTTLQQLISLSEAVPADLERAIRAHKVACRAQSRKTLYGFIATSGACVGLATPYVLKLLGG